MIRLVELARRLDRRINASPEWVWPAFLVALTVAVWVAAWTLQPDGEISVLFGHRLDEPCAFRVAAGFPCPNCGMTRSFVWSSRLQVVRAFWYSPGGATLFWWITAGGITGLVRLITRDPRRLEPPWQLFVAWCTFWVVVLYAIPFALRIWGFNPLP